MIDITKLTAAKRVEVIGDCVLIQGDCLEVMPQIGKVDAVVTDPPYLGLKGGFNHYQTNNLAKSKAITAAVGDPWGASFEWLGEAKKNAELCIVSFCGYADVADIKSAAGLDGWLVTWSFQNSAPSMRNAPWFRNEFAWVFKIGKANWRKLETVVHHPKLNAGCAGSPERLRRLDGTAAHPTQKPVSVVTALIVPDAKTILDPFMGSGTTGVACVRTGRHFIGIELDPDYFEIACRRVREAYAQPDFFVAANENKKPEQLGLLA